MLPYHHQPGTKQAHPIQEKLETRSSKQMRRSRKYLHWQTDIMWPYQMSPISITMGVNRRARLTWSLRWYTTPSLADKRFYDAGYVSICDRSEVNLYDRRTLKITVSKEAAFKGWICLATGLWRIPLQNEMKKISTQTLILDGPTGLE